MDRRQDPLPWERSPGEALFVMVTGANSGIGLGICERLIDEFLTTRPPTVHLVLIPTTRSAAKAAETVRVLRRHARNFATHSKALRALYEKTRPAASVDYDPRAVTCRVHLLCAQLDLLDLASVYRVADRLLSGTLSGPVGLKPDAYFEELGPVRIPRLDAVVFNAGIGGWTGLAWSKILGSFLKAGLVNFTTWPDFKVATVGAAVNPLPGARRPEDNNEKSREKGIERNATSVELQQQQEQQHQIDKEERLGEVFCANVFGHYLLAHALLPLLRRPSGSGRAPGRIVWQSSVTPTWRQQLTLDDFQLLRTEDAYEGSKRLIDVLALTADLPAVRPLSSAYLGDGDGDDGSAGTLPPKIYLCHPGIAATALMPTNPLVFAGYFLAVWLARLLGSPWHPVTRYKSGHAAAWLVLQEQDALDAAGAERVKWGSCTDRWGTAQVKKTEVEGWGWEGRVESPATWRREDETLPRVQRKSVGRQPGAPDLTAERLTEFEALGALCWREMERLRAVWEPRARAVADKGKEGREE